MNNLNILLVEDNLSYALELEMNLKEMGYNMIKTVDNSAEAFEAIFSEEPDLVLMDINIKGSMTGIQVVQKVHTEKIPFVFITANEDEKTYAEAKAAPGVVGYLVKPFNKITLQSTIQFAMKSLVINDIVPKGQEEWQEDKIIKDAILIKNNNIFYKVPFDEIQYLQSDGNYCFVKTETKRFAVKISLKKAILFLPRAQFIQIQQRYVVPRHSILSIEPGKNEVIIKDGSKLPLGRKFKDSLLKTFNLLQ